MEKEILIRVIPMSAKDQMMAEAASKVYSHYLEEMYKNAWDYCDRILNTPPTQGDEGGR
jgi:hypothetical protein